MYDTGALKKLREANQEGEKVRPILRWKDDVELVLKNMCVKRWRTRILGETEWASLERGRQFQL
jgi:predicted DNA-binding antitoxin AbrB/MazE fold protein